MKTVRMSEIVANNAKGIDIIIDGHSHTVLPEGIRVGAPNINRRTHKNLGIVEVDKKVKM